MARREACRILMRSISNASAAATAHAPARSRIRLANISRRSGSSSLLSANPRMGRSGERTTAAANTGPNNAPRPTSSTPAMCSKPWDRASRSYFPWHFITQESAAQERAVRGRLFAFTETRCFTLELAQIVKFGAAHAAGAHHVDMVDDRGMQRENALHPLAEADLSHGNGSAEPLIIAGNYGSFKGLQTFFVAFFDLYVDADGVARAEFGYLA